MTERLWLATKSPRTVLAEVTSVRGGSFTLDRSPYSPGESEYRHPQPADRGIVWLGGDKRNLRKVTWRSGELWHTLDGAVPERGARLRCDLDVERRVAIEDAHLAMHLVASAIARGRLAEFSSALHVQGGGHFAFDVTRATFAPKKVADALARANEAAARTLATSTGYVARSEARNVDAQPFSDALTLPGPEETLRVVTVGDASVLPCDGTLAATTAGLGRIVLKSARPKAAMMALQFGVAAR
ncbi:MAG: alanyl-tRNA editing protein [Thermoplasmatota archaeon]